MKEEFRSILVVCLLILNLCSIANATERLLEMYIPNGETAKADTYLSTIAALPMDKTYYIVEIEPTDFVTKQTVHHLIIHKCLSPVKIGLETFCEEEKIMYAWAGNAPKLTLPNGLGFEVGRGTPVSLLKLTVHFAATPHPNDLKSDQIGVKIRMVDTRQPKTVGVFLLVTGGKISPGTTEHFDVDCKIDEDIEMHVFAFRPHTHLLGKVVSGYVVREVNHSDSWTLIGKEDPMKPQMFYPVKNSADLIIGKNDLLAARCTLENKNDYVIYIGGTSHDEMCNFYIMYWVENNRHPQKDICSSEGPPTYYWNKNPQLRNIPPDSDNL